MTRVVVVTGAAGGIGSVTSAVLEGYGWTVVRMDRRPLSHDGAIQVDIANAEAATRALVELPRVDGLVNNAALQLNKPLLTTSVHEWDEVMQVNLRGAFVCTKAVYPRLLETRGSVVNVGSVHATATSTSVAAYAASKGGLSAFTRALALELAPVRANAVLPGATDTPALRAAFADREAAEETIIGRTPLRRIGDPRDVAEAIAFLLDGERAGFITGEQISVDGGALARLSTE